VKAYFSNGWDSRIVDPDPEKKQYTQRKAAIEQCHDEADSSVVELSSGKCWPKGHYTQQINGVLPAVMTEDIILTHLQSSGKYLKKSESFINVDYSTLQRGHQYFMESYIPGRHIRFCYNDNLVWIQARCYCSQKKNYSMHELKVVISSRAPHHVVKAFCTCTAGIAGMCSHIVGLLK